MTLSCFAQQRREATTQSLFEKLTLICLSFLFLLQLDYNHDGKKKNTESFRSKAGDVSPSNQ